VLELTAQLAKVAAQLAKVTEQLNASKTELASEMLRRELAEQAERAACKRADAYESVAKKIAKQMQKGAVAATGRMAPHAPKGVRAQRTARLAPPTSPGGTSAAAREAANR